MKLLLLDTYGLVYRAFFALPALTTTKGVPINAVYGFTQMLARILTEEHPTHVIAAFDKGLPRKRLALYEEYKSQRSAMPDDLRSQFALVRRVLEAHGIPIVEREGEEADDVIATIARQAGARGAQTDVVTGDLDLLQIVDEQTTVLATRRGITDMVRYTPEAVRERFALEPAQLPDYRGLKGDPSDNLPGIPGIGEKTAIKLIQGAGSLDALLANPGSAPTPKLQALLCEHADIARTCRDVSVVDRELELEIPWEQARFTPPEREKLYSVYRDLEFKALVAKLGGAPQPTLFSQDGEMGGSYRSFTASVDPPEFTLLASLLRESGEASQVALALHEGVVGVCSAVGTAFSFSLESLAHPPVCEAMRDLLAGSSRLLAHDVKHFTTALRPHGLQVVGFVDDTMLLAHLLNPSRSYMRLGDVASEYLERTLQDDAGARADATAQLAPLLRERLSERGQLKLYEELELPLVGVLSAMEAAGIAVDREALTELSVEVDAAIARLQDDVYCLAGKTFNIASPQQLGAVLFEHLGIPGGTRNKTGWATGVEVLQPLSRHYPICGTVLEYREAAKLKNTYINVLPLLIANDGRIHTVFNQTSTATGRLSSTNPNLQNIPVRSELGRRVRHAFVAPHPSRLLLAADYSQIELRIMAHLSGDEAMRAAFARGDDIHDFTAHGIFHLAPEEKANTDQRRIAKSINFGLLYGMSDFGLAQRLEISREQARTMTEAYFGRFPSVRAYIERILASGRENGYVETLLGRRRYFPDLSARNHALRTAAEREATNAPMQGSAADLMKLAMLRVDAALRKSGLDALLLLQIHDELILEIDRSRTDAVARLIKHEMEHAIALSVPLEVTVKIGESWYDVQGVELTEPEAEGIA
jgi:DNA polymerase-1